MEITGSAPIFFLNAPVPMIVAHEKRNGAILH